MCGPTVTPPLRSATRGGWTRGLGCTPPSQVPQTWSSRAPPRAEPRYENSFARQGGLLSIVTQEPNWSRSPSLLSSERLTAIEVCAGPGPADVERQIYSYTPYLLFARQGGLLSIVTQEPNLPRSPSLLGPVLVIRSGPTAVEVCAGPGSADIKHKANRKETTNLEANPEANITNHNCLHNTRRKFKRLHEAWCMLQELKQERSRVKITLGQRRHSPGAPLSVSKPADLG